MANQNQLHLVGEPEPVTPGSKQIAKLRRSNMPDKVGNIPCFGRMCEAVIAMNILALFLIDSY